MYTEGMAYLYVIKIIIMDSFHTKFYRRKLMISYLILTLWTDQKPLSA